MSAKEDINEEGCSIYLGGLPFDSDEGAIKKVFEEFGEVLSTKIVCDRESGKPRGFGFVTFSSARAAQAAIRAMDGEIVDGRPIKVSEVRKRAPPFDGPSGRSLGPPPLRHAGTNLPVAVSAKDDAEGRYQPTVAGGYQERGRERPRAGPPSRPARSWSPDAPEGGSSPAAATANTRWQHDSHPQYRDSHSRSRSRSPLRRPPPRALTVSDSHQGDNATGTAPAMGAAAEESYGRYHPPHSPSPSVSPRPRREALTGALAGAGTGAGTNTGTGTGLLAHQRSSQRRQRDFGAARRDGDDDMVSPSLPLPRGKVDVEADAGHMAVVDAPAGEPWQRKHPPHGTVLLPELRKAVDALKHEKEQVAGQIHDLEEELHLATTNEAAMKERIKVLESAKKDVAVRYEERMQLHQKVLAAAARLQEAQDVLVNGQIELKSLLRPLVLGVSVPVLAAASAAREVAQEGGAQGTASGASARQSLLPIASPLPAVTVTGATPAFPLALLSRRHEQVPGHGLGGKAHVGAVDEWGPGSASMSGVSGVLEVPAAVNNVVAASNAVAAAAAVVMAGSGTTGEADRGEWKGGGGKGFREGEPKLILPRAVPHLH